MFSLKFAISVYILRTWLESIRYFILINPILGTRFQGNEWWNLSKKLLSVRFWNIDEKEEKIPSNYKAFCVTRKHKKTHVFKNEWQKEFNHCVYFRKSGPFFKDILKRIVSVAYVWSLIIYYIIIKYSEFVELAGNHTGHQHAVMNLRLLQHLR